ncbi:flagellar hook-basal body complex protein FliE [Sphingomonas sp. DT-204]|uniref:flagellar hook-basal body complex protein FliE n=1 Tax=Sphingomonas sp. DT-204 TaxID=3396166 RepID=UPI003F1BC24A
MSGAGGISGAMGVDRVMELRAQILERNAALQRANAAAAAAPVGQASPVASFTDTFKQAVTSVNESQAQAGALSAAYERGETIDIAKVMLARQEASIGFEATLQVRNKLLAAYKDIMSMPV